MITRRLFLWLPHHRRNAKSGSLAVVGIALLMGACGDQSATQDFYVEPSTPENPVAQTEAAAAEVADREALPPTSPIQAVEGSGTTGDFTVTYSATEVELQVRVDGLPEVGEFATHVHRGVCAEGGPVAALLSPVVGTPGGGGTSTTTLPPDALPVTEPLFVQIHGSSGAPIACGDLVGGD